jgi:hypothetical protein
MLTRILDLVALLLIAVAVLLPRPDARVQPGLELPAEDRQRVAELEAQLEGKPADVGAALELSGLFLDARRPDWALEVATSALAHASQDHRLWARRAMALADHFEAGGAHEAAARAAELCVAGSSAPCGPGERARLAFLRDTLATVKDLDLRKDPNTAKERMLKALRPAYLPPPRPPRAARPAAPGDPSEVGPAGSAPSAKDHPVPSEKPPARP